MEAICGCIIIAIALFACGYEIEKGFDKLVKIVREFLDNN